MSVWAIIRLSGLLRKNYENMEYKKNCLLEVAQSGKSGITLYAPVHTRRAQQVQSRYCHRSGQVPFVALWEAGEAQRWAGTLVTCTNGKSWN